MFIQYGLQITTRQLGLNSYALGLINGVCRWITGKPDIDTWKEGVVFGDSFSDVSKAIEIAACGSYSTMSGFNLEIDNASGLMDEIKALSLELSQCDAVLYTFRRETELDTWTQTQDWSGKVSDLVYDSNKIKISFMDSFRGVHKSLLKKLFTTNEFGENLPTNLVGEPIPLVFGYVPIARLFPIVRKEIYETICIAGGVSFDVAPCTNYVIGGTSEAYKTYTVYLKTVDKLFSINELAGKFLVEVKGGDGSLKIKSNLASSGGITQIKLYGKFSATPIFWSTTGADVTYFQISSLVVKYIVSQNPIKEFATIEGRGALFVWDDKSLEFDEVSEIGGPFNATNIGTSGYPGCQILSKPSNSLGDTFYQKYKLLSTVTELAETVSNAGAVTGGRPTPGAGTELPNLRDQDGSTYYRWLCTSSGSSHGVLTIPFKTKVDPSFFKGNFSNILVAFNQTINFDTLNDYQIYLNIRLIDHLGRITAPLDDLDRLLFSDGSVGGGAFSSFDSIIPGDYGIYPGPTAPDIIGNLRSALSINQINRNLEQVKDLDIYPFVIIELKYRWRQLLGGSQMELFINELTLVGEKSLNLISDTLYTKAKGTLFGSTWDSRKTATNPIINIADMTEACIRLFDERPDVLDATAFDIVGNSSTGLRKNWYIGQQIEKDVNTFDVIDELCRFGFFGMIPKNNGKRAPIAWMENSVIATHNDLNNTINEGTIGEKRETSLADVYNEPQVNYDWNPASENFNCVLAITKIDQSSFPIEVLFDKPRELIVGWALTYIALGGGVFEVTVNFTQPRTYKTGDYITVEFSSDGYNIILAKITKISATIFKYTMSYSPTYVGSSTAGDMYVDIQENKTWKTFAIGYNDDEYLEAKLLWENCHKSFIKYGFVRKLPDEMSNAKWFPDVEKEFGLDHVYNAAKAYMRELCKWTPFIKEIVPYQLPNTATHANLELLDRILFSDSTDRGGAAFEGVIVRKSIFPGLGKDYIEIDLMLDPEI
jgi:hypothetical protein